MGRNWVLQHDNDPKHKAHLVTKWLDEKEVERLKWPSFSLDLNTMEHIWDEIERRMRKEKNLTKKLVHSVPNRLHEVIRMNGYPTRY